MRIADTCLGQIVRAAEKALAKMLELPECTKPERKGGYLCLRRKSDGQLLALVLIGVIEDLKFARSCAQVALLKTEMLLMHPETTSTYSLRSLALGYYGGGVALDALDLLISFSGSDEHGDEAIVLGTCQELEWSTDDFSQQVADISHNHITSTLLPALKAA